jgi:CubicO group peptidase (beta-lactamase class C family)
MRLAIVRAGVTRRSLGPRRRGAVLLAIALVTAGCGESTAPGGSRPPIDLSAPWVVASPASQGVDSALLAVAYAAAARTAGLRSLLVARNGFLVGEQYFGTVTADSLSDVRSVTKSVMSLLVGIAIAHGALAGTDEPLDRLLHPPVATIDGEQARITVEHLLTMTSGFEWDESTAAGYNAWVLAPDQIQYLLDRPLSDPPGTRFNYNSAAVHLLSAGLSEATGLTAAAFADRYLFTPLGITVHTWETDNRGYSNGGSGLALRSRDLARIGELVLQHGASGAVQVVPASWIDRMLAVHEHTHTSYGPLSNFDYGYLWWLTTIRGHAAALAWGYRGQYLLLIPDLRLVVVATAALDAPIPADDEGEAVLRLIVDDVLAAVRG